MIFPHLQHIRRVLFPADTLPSRLLAYDNKRHHDLAVRMKSCGLLAFYSHLFNRRINLPVIFYLVHTIKLGSKDKTFTGRSQDAIADGYTFIKQTPL